jgi:hypothetical protein
MLPSETQACASVTSAFLQVRPNRDRRATPHTRAEVFLFSALFADCASARCRVRPSLEKVVTGFRNAIVGRVGRGRARSIALGARSRSVGRARVAPIDPSRVSPPRARARRRRRRRATPIEAGVFRRDSTPRVTTRICASARSRDRDEKKKKKKTASDDLSSPTRALLLSPRLLTTTYLDSSRFSRRFTSPRLGATTAGGTS